MNLIDKLGGIKTDFNFSVNGMPVDVHSQYLVKRGMYHYNTYGSEVYRYGYGYGYGLESLYFEMILVNFNPTPIVEETSYDSFVSCLMYQIQFFQGEQLVLSKGIWSEKYGYFNSDEVKTISSMNLVALSLNLVRTPFSLISLSDRVDIVLKSYERPPQTNEWDY